MITFLLSCRILTLSYLLTRGLNSRTFKNSTARFRVKPVWQLRALTAEITSNQAPLSLSCADLCIVKRGAGPDQPMPLSLQD